MSGANQYRVTPAVLVSTVTPPIVAVLTPLVDAGAGLPARATVMPNTPRARVEMPATAGPAPGMPACSLASSALRGPDGPACRPGAAGGVRRVPRRAHAAPPTPPA